MSLIRKKNKINWKGHIERVNGKILYARVSFYKCPDRRSVSRPFCFEKHDYFGN